MIWTRLDVRPSLALGTLLAVVLLGCPRPSGTMTSGQFTSDEAVTLTATATGRGAPEVVFHVIEMGSGSPLLAYVWASGYQHDFEVVHGTSGAVFKGLGRTRDGYVVPFEAEEPVTLLVWAPQHELTAIDVVFAQGPNTLDVELRRTKVSDERVPMEIWISVMENMLMTPSPTEDPKTGS